MLLEKLKDESIRKFSSHWYVFKKQRVNNFVDQPNVDKSYDSPYHHAFKSPAWTKLTDFC